MKKLTLSYRIIKMTTMVITISMVCLGVIVYIYSKNTIEKQIIKDYNTNINQKVKQIEFIMEDLYLISQEISVSNEVQDFLISHEKVSEIDKTMSYMKNYSYLREYIDSFVLIDTNGNCFWNIFPYSSYFEYKLKEDWYSYDRKLYGRFSRKHVVFTDGNVKTDVISFITDINNINRSDNKIGELIINIKVDFLENLFQENNSEDGQLLINPFNELIYKDYKKFDSAKVNDYIKDIEFQNGGMYRKSDNMVFYKKLNNGFKYIIITNSKIFHDIRLLLMFFVLLTIIISIIIMMIFLGKIISDMTRPITNLASAMERLSEENLKIRVETNSYGEIQILEEGFNNMAVKLEEYVKKIIEYEKKKRDMELELLMSQINPHFIYNTLNSIVYMARKGKNKNIENMTKAFINILQDSIKVTMSPEAMFEQVENEIDTIKSYVEIQKVRYRDKFHIEFFIDEEIKKIYIPKIILQPLIENAIYHGISPLSREGNIIVDIHKDGEYVFISVEDDGMGIEKEKVDNMFIFEDRKYSNSLKSIGLYNIKERLDYIYKQDYMISIKSDIDKGCRVVIELPLVNKN
ncbi:sensor histidine kinase [Vallitalea longa]|nr:histidine kinase [Vallitalea longa]